MGSNIDDTEQLDSEEYIKQTTFTILCRNNITKEQKTELRFHIGILGETILSIRYSKKATRLTVSLDGCIPDSKLHNIMATVRKVLKV